MTPEEIESWLAYLADGGSRYCDTERAWLALHVTLAIRRGDARGAAAAMGTLM